MNNRRVGKFAVTAIVGLLSAIAGIASMEMINSLKKETETGPGSAHKSDKGDNRSQDVGGFDDPDK